DRAEDGQEQLPGHSRRCARTTMSRTRSITMPKVPPSPMTSPKGPMAKSRPMVRRMAAAMLAINAPQKMRGADGFMRSIQMAPNTKTPVIARLTIPRQTDHGVNQEGGGARNCSKIAAKSRKAASDSGRLEA